MFLYVGFLGVAGKDERIYRGRVAFGIKPEFLQQSDAGCVFLLNAADHFPLRVELMEPFCLRRQQFKGTPLSMKVIGDGVAQGDGWGCKRKEEVTH